MKPLHGVAGTCARFQWTLRHWDLLISRGGGGYHHLAREFSLCKRQSVGSPVVASSASSRGKCSWRWPEESLACQNLPAGTGMENTHARLKSSPTTEAEKSVVSSGLGVMLREDE